MGALTVMSFAGHVMYPLYLLASERLAPRSPYRPRPGEADWTWDDVDVLIPAFGEASILAETVPQLLGEGVPLDRITVVVDEDEKTRAVAEELGCRVDWSPTRAGKAAAVNRGVGNSSADIVVLLDANAFVPGEGLRALIDRVATDLHLASGVRKESGAQDEGLYWRYENWIKQTEAGRGGSLALVGEAVALRRESFRPIPGSVLNDDLFLAFDFARRGLDVGVVPECVAVEDSAPRGDQLERRVRIMSGQLRLFWGFRRSFVSGDDKFLHFAMHKGWRSTLGPAAQLTLTAACLARPRSRFSQAFLLAEAVSVAAYLKGDKLQGRAAAPLRVLGQAVGMPPVVFALAIPRALGRSRSGAWKKRTR
ncbi:glycosyltransferase involved in cell wall biosynthesis [Kineococcus radiotolerans]|uniref:4,4'-diaponeurosporenoate glycosyltransferase n=1 Tax=Kineococcus radiotolerans TaxID=131568 RepID=A0A7W4TLR0_KINRA|nr:glycosyltransferase [Kineococcus radiotolerans]MBB2900792.1 glycosyltransferase involved in cell wall biosynthesis [Kineococcus radiotolerans]